MAPGARANAKAKTKANTIGTGKAMTRPKSKGKDIAMLAIRQVVNGKPRDGLL